MRRRSLLLPLLLALPALPACGGGGGGPGPLPILDLLFANIDFGTVELNAPVERQVRISNPAGGAAAVLNSIEASSGDVVFTADLPALPFSLGGGGTVSFTVRWTPPVEGGLAATVTVEFAGRDPIVVALSGLAFPAEETVDLGLQGLDAQRETAELSVDVPANAISFSIEAHGGPRTSPVGGPIFLAELTGPDGTVFVNPAAPHAGPYVFERNFPQTSGPLPRTPIDFAVFRVPNSDRAAVQLVPGGGVYRFRLSNAGGNAASLSVRVTIERREGGAIGGGRLPLNVFLSNALNVSADDAPNDAHIQGVLGRAHTLLRNLAGIGFGDVDYFRLTNPAFDQIDPNNPDALFQQAAVAGETRLNVFLVDQALFGAAGLSGAIPGHRVNGTRYAALYALANRGFNADDEGTVLAHEICHALGLGHTVEAVGAAPWTHDLLDDTCPGAACVDDPAQNLMIFQALPPGPPQLTPGQVRILNGSPFLEPGLPTFVPLAGLAGLAGRNSLRRLTGVCCANCRR